LQAPKICFKRSFQFLDSTLIFFHHLVLLFFEDWLETMTDVWTLDKLRVLSYRELQHLAQEHNIKSNIKVCIHSIPFYQVCIQKLDLITKLTSKLVDAHDLTEDSDAPACNDEMMELDAPPIVNSPIGRLNETFSIEEKSLANSTYILDADNNQKSR
jgi:hypothetical protein